MAVRPTSLAFPLNLQLFDVVVVPFPFTDRAASKRRPALVISSANFNRQAQNSVLAMITSAEQSRWPGDVLITGLDAAGLTSDCVARMKIFTLDHRLILRKAGVLALADQKTLLSAWQGLLLV